MKLFAMILAMLLCSSIAFAEKMVTLPESELKGYLDQIVKDDAKIKALTTENYKLKLDIMNMRVELDDWKQKDDKQMGFYLGGGVGYPLPSVEIAALYKFRRWGLFVSGGYYGKAPAINVGVMVKTK